MRTAWWVIASLCVLHIAALLGVIGYAVATHRIDRERLDTAFNLFRHPITDEPDDDVAQQLDEDALQTTVRIERMLGGPTAESIADRLESEQQRNEMTLRQIERTRTEVQSLSRNLQLSQQRIEEQRQQLVEARQQFQDRLREVQQQFDDEGFQRAVTLMESLPPRQAKNMFIEMIDDQERDQVVAYLMAMQPRRASAILREFQTADETRYAIELTEMLRGRGSRLVENLEDLG